MGAPLTLLLAVNGLITPYVEGLVAPLVVQRFCSVRLLCSIAAWEFMVPLACYEEGW